jgi:hypothetical protein
MVFSSEKISAAREIPVGGSMSDSFSCTLPMFWS